MSYKAVRLHLVLFLIIISNIVNMMFPKSMGFEIQRGFEYQLSKYTYGLCILLMFPSLFTGKKYYFNKMNGMTWLILVYIVFGFALSMEFEIGNYLKTMMICLSFVFFEDVLKSDKINRYMLYCYILSVFLNVVYLIFLQNRLDAAIENEGHVRGGQGIANSIIYLLPLVFYKLNGKVSSLLFIVGAIAVFVSMRRSAILALLICVPFVYSYLKQNVSKYTALFLFVILVIGGYYIYNHYYYILVDRFTDMFEASDSGYYGSSRTGWWKALIALFIDNPMHWLQGFGLGKVTQFMGEAGFPFETAHNDYIEIGFTYGIIGLILWFGTIFSIYRLSKMHYNNFDSSLLKMCVLSYLFIAIVSGASYQPHFMSVALFANLVLLKLPQKR